MVKTSPSNAGGVGSIPGRGANVPHASQPKNQNIKQKQYCNKFNKDFKRMVHIKKKSLGKKKRKEKEIWVLISLGIVFSVIFHIHSAITCTFYLRHVSVICLLLCPPGESFLLHPPTSLAWALGTAQELISLFHYNLASILQASLTKTQS